MALDLSKFTIDASGNIRQVSAFVPGTDSRFTTLELHAALQDLADNATPSGDDNVSILGSNPSELAGKRNASRPMALTLLPNFNINDATAQWFKFGSVEQNSGNDLYTGLKVIGSLVASSPIYIIQNAAKLTKYWSDADVNTAFQILVKAKAAGRDVALSDEVSELLAANLTRDVRHIESCLHNLILRAQLLNAEITPDLAWEIVNHYAEQNPALDMGSIIATVCRAFGLTETQLRSKSRKSDYVVARNSVFYLARKHTDCSLQQIGASLNRAHTTVIKGISALEREINRKSPKGLQISNTLTLIEKNAAAH